MSRPLRVATRGSELARWQAGRVAELLGGDVELVVITTQGDARTDVPIHAVGGTGIFVKEVQQAVLAGQADIAVHSAKDLPASAAPDGIVLAAVPERIDPRDALVGGRLDTLAPGARIGTGSVRRRAQLASLRPDLTFAELRGNVPTRLERADAFDAIVVAVAALERLGVADQITEILEPAVMLPQVGQGALAVECRIDDTGTRERLAAIDDMAAHAAVGAERAFLAQLSGGCDLPCGALATVGAGAVAVEALLASLDGRIVLRATGTATNPVEAGIAAAADLFEHGGRMLLDGITGPEGGAS
jgi:hydroxymethylbilane synthase